MEKIPDCSSLQEWASCYGHSKSTTDSTLAAITSAKHIMQLQRRFSQCFGVVQCFCAVLFFSNHSIAHLYQKVPCLSHLSIEHFLEASWNIQAVSEKLELGCIFFGQQQLSLSCPLMNTIPFQCFSNSGRMNRDFAVTLFQDCCCVLGVIFWGGQQQS